MSMPGSASRSSDAPSSFPAPGAASARPGMSSGRRSVLRRRSSRTVFPMVSSQPGTFSARNERREFSGASEMLLSRSISETSSPRLPRSAASSPSFCRSSSSAVRIFSSVPRSSLEAEPRESRKSPMAFSAASFCLRASGSARRAGFVRRDSFFRISDSRADFFWLSSRRSL